MAGPQPKGQSAAIYALTIFTSAFLIFQVQPLISKSILPWFGGTPGVWTTCMLFFQLVLFAGYAYAHGSIRWLSSRMQAVLHLGLLLSAVLLLPVSPNSAWKPTGDEVPTLRILGLLATTVGLPYFLLSATGPMLQAWFGQTRPGASPYRLYALSNIGSVLGLVSYPFVIEPFFSSVDQAFGWSVAFGAFVIACGACAVDLLRRSRQLTTATTAVTEVATPPTWKTMGLWFGLSACASVMLLATTNQVCLDVAVIPFLWVLPLTLYLASFIFVFDREWWYPRRTYAVALAGAIFCLTLTLQAAHESSLIAQVGIHFTTLFFCCMVCHGELVRLRPAPQYLTTFYLASSAGGATGGLLVGVIAPLVLTSYLELPLALMAGCAIVVWVFFSDRELLWNGTSPRWTWACVLIVVWSGLRLIGVSTAAANPNELEVTRNFYGVLRIVETDLEDPSMATRRMVHGRIVHGMQFLDPTKKKLPTAYYSELSGIGMLLRSTERDHQPRHVGVVGLGVGTLAAYAHRGDRFRFYEINPDVIRLADDHFSCLADCAGKVDVILGDARLKLEQEPPQEFDVLILDAFSSDAVPAHLLTEEAFAIYMKHLKPNGVLAVHVTNRHFDLEPVIRGAAEHYGLHPVKIHTKTDATKHAARCDWMMMVRNSSDLDTPELQAAIAATSQRTREPILWTDRFNHVVGVMK